MNQLRIPSWAVQSSVRVLFPCSSAGVFDRAVGVRNLLSFYKPKCPFRDQIPERRDTRLIFAVRKVHNSPARDARPKLASYSVSEATPPTAFFGRVVEPFWSETVNLITFYLFPDRTLVFELSAWFGVLGFFFLFDSRGAENTVFLSCKIGILSSSQLSFVAKTVVLTWWANKTTTSNIAAPMPAYGHQPTVRGGAP